MSKNTTRTIVPGTIGRPEQSSLEKPELHGTEGHAAGAHLRTIIKLPPPTADNTSGAITVDTKARPLNTVKDRTMTLCNTLLAPDNSRVGKPDISHKPHKLETTGLNPVPAPGHTGPVLNPLPTHKERHKPDDPQAPPPEPPEEKQEAASFIALPPAKAHNSSKSDLLGSGKVSADEIKPEVQ